MQGTIDLESNGLLFKNHRVDITCTGHHLQSSGFLVSLAVSVFTDGDGKKVPIIMHCLNGGVVNTREANTTQEATVSDMHKYNKLCECVRRISTMTNKVGPVE